MTSTRRASSAESLTPAWTVWEVWAGVWAWQPNTATVTINARQRSGLQPLSTVSIISRELAVFGVGAGWAQRCVRLFRRHLPDVAAYFFKDITLGDPALFSSPDGHAEAFQLGLIFLLILIYVARVHGNPPITSILIGNSC